MQKLFFFHRDVRGKLQHRVWESCSIFFPYTIMDIVMDKEHTTHAHLQGKFHMIDLSMGKAGWQITMTNKINIQIENGVI